MKLHIYCRYTYAKRKCQNARLGKEMQKKGIVLAANERLFDVFKAFTEEWKINKKKWKRK